MPRTRQPIFMEEVKKDAEAALGLILEEPGTRPMRSVSYQFEDFPRQLSTSRVPPRREVRLSASVFKEALEFLYTTGVSTKGGSS